MISQKVIPLICPECEVYPMVVAAGNMRARCPGCGFELGGAMLKTLIEVLSMPEVLGSHACEECGHPEMRLLPGGIYHCPACCAEVLPIGGS
jgi:ribosomal protein L37AE/L43A